MRPREMKERESKLHRADFTLPSASSISIFQSRVTFYDAISEHLPAVLADIVLEYNMNSLLDIATLKRLATRNHEAIARLGHQYCAGIGVKRNTRKGIKWLSLAIKKLPTESPIKSWVLGLCHLYGINMENTRSFREAVHYFMDPASLGYAPAQYFLGLYYDDNEHDFDTYNHYKNRKRAIEFYEKSAAQGYAPAQCNLGLLYDRALKQPYKAAKLYYYAAQQGLARAQLNLGIFYYRGIAVPQNIQKAVTLFHLAAKQGLARAQFNLGICYQRGTGIARSVTKAIELFQLAAAKGNERAKLNLRTFHNFLLSAYRDKGIIVTDKLEKVMVCQYLGDCYECGLGVDRNVAKAASWHRKAARIKEGKTRARTATEDDSDIFYDHEKEEFVNKEEFLISVSGTVIVRR